MSSLQISKEHIVRGNLLTCHVLQIGWFLLMIRIVFKEPSPLLTSTWIKRKASAAPFNHRSSLPAKREEITCRRKTFTTWWDLNVSFENLEKWGRVRWKREGTPSFVYPILISECTNKKMSKARKRNQFMLDLRHQITTPNSGR